MASTEPTAEDFPTALSAAFEELVSRDGQEPVQKPFPNEHAARQEDPSRYSRFRRGHPKGFPEGIDAIWGITRDGAVEIQSLRFAADTWSPERAVTWLKEHDFEAGIERATEKDDDAYSVAEAAAGTGDDEYDGVQWSAKVLKADAAQQIVYGVVLEPDVVDTQEEIISAVEIEKAAHFYLAKSAVVGDTHRKVSEATEVVESYIAPVDFTLNEQPVRKGSWVLAVHIQDPATWAKVEKGELNAFSVGGFSRKVAA